MSSKDNPPVTSLILGPVLAVSTVLSKLSFGWAAVYPPAIIAGPPI